MQRQNLNQHQVHWVQYLSRFNAVWCYKPRPSMGKPDVLSRQEDHTEGIEDDNKGVIVITLDNIRMTILIMDEGNSLIFNATCLLSEADVQRLCKKNTICKECNGMPYDNLGRLYVTILFLGSTLFLISSFHTTSPFLGSLFYAYHHYLLILGPLTFTIHTL